MEFVDLSKDEEKEKEKEEKELEETSEEEKEKIVDACEKIMQTLVDHKYTNKVCICALLSVAVDVAEMCNVDFDNFSALAKLLFDYPGKDE